MENINAERDHASGDFLRSVNYDNQNSSVSNFPQINTPLPESKDYTLPVETSLSEVAYILKCSFNVLSQLNPSYDPAQRIPQKAQ